MFKNNYFAFFDVDETIVNVKTMFSFLHYYCVNYKHKNRILGNLKYASFKLKIYFYIAFGKNREFLNSYYYLFYKNCSKFQLDCLSKKWFENVLLKGNFFNHKVVAELKNHQKNNATIVLVSGSFFPCLDPIAKFLNVNHTVSTKLELVNGKLTGKIIPPQTIGFGKVLAIKEIVNNEKDACLEACFAYGDHCSDIPMLEAIGNPVVVGGDPKIVRYARAKGWRII